MVNISRRKNRMKKILFITSFSIIFAVGCGYGFDCNIFRHKTTTTEKPEQPPQAPKEAAYIAPAETEVAKGCNCFVTGNFLYWHASEDGLDLGSIQTDNYSNPIDMQFGYKPGFKIGLGINKIKDHWSMYAEFMRYYAKETQELTNEENSIYSAWNTEDEALSYIKGEWKLKTNLITWQMGRACYFGKKLTVNPHFGLKGGLLDQTFTLQTTVPVNNTSDSWLVGPRIGANTKWLLGAGFSFSANAAGSLLYQDFNIHNKRTEVDNIFKEQRKFHQITPLFECLLGMGWGRYLTDNSWHFNLFTGYEFQYFLNQNQMRKLIDGQKTGKISTSAGDLMLHGLTVTVRLDF